MIGDEILGATELMTQRADLVRDHAVPDDLGGKPAGDWQPLATVPCFMWWGTGATISRAGSVQQRPELTVDLDIGGMILPAGTDITARDRIAQVTDQAGNVIEPGPLAIRAVAQFEGLTEVSLYRLS